MLFVYLSKSLVLVCNKKKKKTRKKKNEKKKNLIAKEKVLKKVKEW